MKRYILSAAKNPDAILIPIFEDQDILKNFREIDKLSGGALQTLVMSKDFEGKKMQVSLIYTKSKNFPRVYLLGLGKQKNCSIRTYKNVLGSGVIAAQSKKVTKLHILFSSQLKNHFDISLLAKETVIAVDGARYAFEDHKNKESCTPQVQECTFECTLSAQEKKEWDRAVIEGKCISEGVELVRNLGNTIPSIMTPVFLAQNAKSLETDTVKVKILSLSQIQKLGMGCFLAVSQGSIHEPKFIILEYFAGDKKEAPTVLVGKGITYDSGGISLKPADALIDMKFDMLGGATVLGAILAASKLKIKKNIVGLIPACENMPSGTAYRPDDILTAMNGKTVLVENTDAEGRLILADALVYAQKYTPKEVIDLATLTGHCLIALGNERSGLFTQDEQLATDLLSASNQVGELLWRLPLGEEYSEAVKADVADLRNTGGVGNPRYGGASTAAAFLENFTDYPWAHIDLSCSHYGGKGKSWIRGGANGFGVQTLVEYLKK